MKILICILLCYYSQSINIDEYGAIANENTLNATKINTNILQQYSLSNTTVYIPNQTYYIYPFIIVNQSNVIINITGTLVAYYDINHWPYHQHYYNDLIQFENCDNIYITGSGSIDGQGYNWWKHEIHNQLNYTRPNLLTIYTSNYIIIEYMTFLNSPQYHVILNDVYNATIRYNTIFVQPNQKKLKEWIPTFPLNTDGIDVSGRFIHIHDCTIQNFDDAIAVKSLNNQNINNCSEHILIEYITVTFGVGLSIGSVSPNTYTNCVKNVTFQYAQLHYPIKSIYVKTNPGNKGNGIISDIYYKHFIIHSPTWYNIYIGPQQEKEPNGYGAGCMIYPWESCPTQPRITISNIFLTNITTYNGLFELSTIVRCNESNPCDTIVFSNVTANKQHTSICENLIDSVVNNCCL